MKDKDICLVGLYPHRSSRNYFRQGYLFTRFNGRKILPAVEA
jgi:hypothetical protein